MTSTRQNPLPPTRTARSGNSAALWALIALAAVMAEAAIAYRLQDDGWEQALLRHGGVTLALLALAWPGARRERSALPWLLPLFTGFGGPLGAGICFVAAMVSLFLKPSSPEDLFDAMLPDTEQGESAKLYERIAFGLDNVGGTGVQPLQDILGSGGMLEKQAAIVKITRWFRPQFAPLLRMASLDADASVRVQAATAIAKLERDYMLRYLTLEQEMKQGASTAQRRDMAGLCYDFALSGIADEEMYRQLSARAIALYEELLAEGDDTPELRPHLARLHLENDHPRQTASLLTPLLEDDSMDLEEARLYMEALYEMKQYDSLRDLAKRADFSRHVVTGTPEAEDIEQMLRLWAEGPDAAWEAPHAA